MALNVINSTTYVVYRDALSVEGSREEGGSEGLEYHGLCTKKDKFDSRLGYGTMFKQHSVLKLMSNVSI